MSVAACHWMQVLKATLKLISGPIDLPADVRSPHYNEYDKKRAAPT